MSLHLCSQERGDISIQVHPMLENPVWEEHLSLTAPPIIRMIAVFYYDQVTSNENLHGNACRY